MWPFDDDDPYPEPEDEGTGKQERDKGISQVEAAERLAWRIQHDKELWTFLQVAAQPFLTEDFRAWYIKRGNAPPHHPNVWGAMWMRVVRKLKWVERAGSYRSPKSVKSHARAMPEWKVKL